MNVLVIHQCSKGFLPRLISAFYLGSGTEAYWGEAKKFTFWPRLSPEAIDPVLCLGCFETGAIYTAFCLGSVRTEAIGNKYFFLIHPFARSWLLQTAFKPKHKLHSSRVLDHPAFKPKHKLQESRTTQDHSISATFSPSISAGVAIPTCDVVACLSETSPLEVSATFSPSISAGAAIPTCDAAACLSFAAKHGLGVCAIALEVADAEVSTTRRRTTRP